MAANFLRSVGASISRTSVRSISSSARLMGGHGGEVSIAKPVGADGIPRAADKIIKVTFVDPDNNRLETEGICGESLYKCAMRNQVGMRATCGGNLNADTFWGDNGLACFNCHVHVANDFLDAVNQQNHISESEVERLEECDEERSDVNRNSRLSCQITLTPELDGITVLIPTFSRADVI